MTMSSRFFQKSGRCLLPSTKRSFHCSHVSTSSFIYRSKVAPFYTRTFQKRFFAKGKRNKNRQKNKNKSSNQGGGIPGVFTATLTDVRKVLPGGRIIFNNVNLSFLEGAKIGVVGPNGAGKSSLLKILGNVDKNFDGDCWRREHMKIGYLEQEPELDNSKTVLENVLDGLKEQTDLLAKYDACSTAMGEPDADFDVLLEEQGKLQGRIDDLDCWNMKHDIENVMGALNCPPNDTKPNHLSGGERRRVALARLLLERPEMLLLDEPTNHLDERSVQWLEQYLDSYKGTVIAITHDRYFLDNVAGWILEVEAGKLLPFEGNYAGWMEAKEKRLSASKKAEKRKKAMMRRELEWIRSNQKGGQAKGKARANAFAAMEEEDKLSNAAQRVESGAIVIPPAPRLGGKLLSAKNLGHTFDEGMPTERKLFDNLSFDLLRGQRIGIIGPNGVGKTTLIRILSEELKPDRGAVIRGPTVQLGVVSQSRSSLNDKNSVYEEISQGKDTIEIDGREVKMRTYVSSFNLRGEAQEKKISTLSGGERNRVHLAKELQKRCNVLFLDEPSNDLDVDTLRSLEEALWTFEGSLLCISHDRWFLDRLCTDIIAFDGRGNVEFHQGSYESYLELRDKRGDLPLGGERKVKFRALK